MQTSICSSLSVLFVLQLMAVSSVGINILDPQMKPSNWEKSSWERFQIRHLLNPYDPGNANYSSWNTKTWTKWLRKREFLHQVATHFRGFLLTQQFVNTVIIGTPEEVEYAFKNPQEGPSSGMFWSNFPFKTYVIMNQNQERQVLDCGGLYFTSTLESDYPNGNRTRAMLRCIPGPRPLPILGNLLTINIPDEDVFNLHERLRETYGERYKLKFGFTYHVVLHNPKDIEKLLSSKMHIQKGNTYDLITPWLGDGLLTSQGAKWNRRRKMLTPSFHFNILTNFIPVFNEQSNILVKILKEECTNGVEVDIRPYIVRCTLDIVGESTLDVQLNTQRDRNNPYLRATSRLCELTLFRATTPWYWVQFLWDVSSYGQEWKELLKVVHEYTTKVIRKKKEDRRDCSVKPKEASQEIQASQDYIYWNGKAKLAFLDVLLEAQKDPVNDLTDVDIREEVDTFVFEGHDTLATSIHWTLFLIGLHPECQEKLHEELDGVFGTDRACPITPKDLTQMKYLDLCIKESLRLFPSVPFISRTLHSDLRLDETTVIPKGANVHILPSHIHRNEAIFPNSREFIPDRFLPENSVKRHPFAYIPFSAGPRNCIGQKFASMEEKIVLANLLRNFVVGAVEPLENIVVLMEVVLKAKNGLKIILLCLFMAGTMANSYAPASPPLSYTAPAPVREAPLPSYAAPAPATPVASYGSSYDSSSVTHIPITKYTSENNEGVNHRVGFESGHGISHDENVAIRLNPGAVGTAEDSNHGKASLTKTGTIGYTSPEGTRINLQYTADENGFHPIGDHLPTPPPTPEAILESLRVIAAAMRTREATSAGSYGSSYAAPEVRQDLPLAPKVAPY
ncbi:unnamed protein product [Allacma fusca]|uniref:Cytochrome P450 n=1 Tax=Allacma fusca TaxID=39272 RepID=A0A8J2KCC3_9HEXA|nr:unnamed protein product [Allacma fusca]